MTAEKTNGISNLVEAMDRVMEKGVVVEARIVVPSVEIYLKYAEAVQLTAEVD